MPSRQPGADISGMRCGNCGAEIWVCASCHETCSTPACADCVMRHEAGAHEAATVVLPQLDPSPVDW